MPGPRLDRRARSPGASTRRKRGLSPGVDRPPTAVHKPATRAPKHPTSGFAIVLVVCQVPGPLANPSESIQCKPLQVVVDGKGVERAIKHLKRKLAAEGLLRELKKRRHYMKPSIKKRKKIAEAARRRRKRERMTD